MCQLRGLLTLLPAPAQVSLTFSVALRRLQREPSRPGRVLAETTPAFSRLIPTITRWRLRLCQWSHRCNGDRGIVSRLYRDTALRDISMFSIVMLSFSDISFPRFDDTVCSSSIVDLTAAVVECAQNDRYRHSVLF